jgi:hypothetical protein
MDDDLRSRYRINRPAHSNPYQPPAQPDLATHHPKVGTKPKEELFLPEAAAVSQPQKPKKSKKLLLGSLILIVLIAAAGGLYHQRHSKVPAAAAPAIPLPGNISSQVNFPIYYPSPPAPAGYTYSSGSASVQKGLVFYKLSDGSKSVFFTEQASPSNPVDLNALPNYKQFSVPAGTAAIGANLGKPAGLVLSGSTLINASTSGGVTAGELNDIFRSLAPVPKQ